MNRYLPLLPVISLCFVSCREDVSDASVDLNPSPVERVEQRLVELENELLREKNARLEKDAEHRALLLEIRNLIEERDEVSIEKVAPPTESLEKVGVPATKEVDQSRKDAIGARESARLEAVGETYAHLVTISGEEYHDLEISEVTDLGVVFRHRTGVARIPFSDLPAKWGERFHHDPARAEKASRNELLAQMRRDKVIASEMAALKEKAEQEAVDAQLALLADAVNDLRRRDNDRGAQQIAIGGAFANPPFLLQDDFGFWGGLFCPPILQSPVIHPPVIRSNPHSHGIIRTGNGTGGRVGSSGVNHPRVQRPSTSGSLPPIQRVSPSVVAPTSRTRTGSSAVSRPRVVRPTTSRRSSTRTVSPSTGSRSGGRSSPAFRKSR